MFEGSRTPTRTTVATPPRGRTRMPLPTRGGRSRSFSPRRSVATGAVKRPRTRTDSHHFGTRCGHNRSMWNPGHSRLDAHYLDEFPVDDNYHIDPIPENSPHPDEPDKFHDAGGNEPHDTFMTDNYDKYHEEDQYNDDLDDDYAEDNDDYQDSQRQL